MGISKAAESGKGGRKPAGRLHTRKLTGILRRRADEVEGAERALAQDLAGRVRLPESRRCAEEIRSQLAQLASWLDDADRAAAKLAARFPDSGYTQQWILEHCEREIARIHRSVFGENPAKRRRLALMRVIDNLASGRTIRTDEVNAVLCGAFSGITGHDLTPIVSVWLHTTAGAKSVDAPGNMSKWKALARLIERAWGDSSKHDKLRKEWEAENERTTLTSD